MLTNVKAVLFDFDGTLADTMGVWKDVDIRFFKDRNMNFPKDLQSNIEGLSMRETAEYFKNYFDLPEEIDELMGIWNDMARVAYSEEIELKPGAYEFLHYLKKNDIKTAIATSNSRELIDAALSGLNIEDMIDIVVTANEVEHGKPSPDVYLRAADLLEISYDSCLVFEDIIPGIEAGHNADMKVCAVYDDYSAPDDDKKKAAADYYIVDYREVFS